MSTIQNKLIHKNIWIFQKFRWFHDLQWNIQGKVHSKSLLFKNIELQRAQFRYKLHCVAKNIRFSAKIIAFIILFCCNRSLLKSKRRINIRNVEERNDDVVHVQVLFFRDCIHNGGVCMSVQRHEPQTNTIKDNKMYKHNASIHCSV